MSSPYKYIGSNRPSPEAPLKVTGQLIYGSDLRLPGMLHAALVLSTRAHARVARIDPTRALALPGVLAVLTHLDAPERRYCRYRIAPGQAGCIDDEPVFAITVRCVGDRVAAVVATTRALARRAARLIDIEYEPLTPVLDAAEALEADGQLVHAYDYATGAAGVPPPGAITTTSEVSTQRLHHAALEPHMCIANLDAAGKLTIWSPCQSVYGVRTVVADLYGLPYSRVRVVKVPMGGSFGGKQEAILEPVTACLALRLRRPVSLVLDREECISATMVRPAQRSRVTSTVRADGTLLDLEVDTLLDAGAYATSSPTYAEAMAKKLTRLYRTPRYRHRGRVVYTNTPTAGGLRGWGSPEIATCMEIHLDGVARRLGLDPMELRLRNLIGPGELDPLSGQSVGDARIRESLERGASAFRWHERAAAGPGSGRYRHAVGVACGAHKNGLYGGWFNESTTMTLKMNEDGTLNLNASLHEVGAGTLDLMRAILAEELDVPPGQVAVCEADTESTPYDYGCFSSRMTYVCGAGARALAAALREALVASAAELLGLPATDLVARGAGVRPRVGVDAGLDYGAIVRATRAATGRDAIVTHTYRAASSPGAYSAQFAAVAVDTLTGLVRVTDFLTALDIGRAINPTMVEGQCRGAVQAGIGSALLEEVLLDRTGGIAAGGFRNYHLVNAVDMPEVDVLLIEHDGDDGPYGAKSVGEIAAVPTAAAVVNAVNRALGTSLATLPLTPDRILAALAGLPSPASEPSCASR